MSCGRKLKNGKTCRLRAGHTYGCGSRDYPCVTGCGSLVNRKGVNCTTCVLMYPGALPTQRARKVLSKPAACQWPICQTTDDDSLVIEHLPRDACNHPRIYVCAICIRGWVHPACNVEIGKYDFIAKRYGIHPKWERSVAKYLECGAGPMWIPDKMSPFKPRVMVS